MKRGRFLQKLTAVLLLAALACPIGSQAVVTNEWQSTKTTYRYAGHAYDGWTILYWDGGNQYRSSSWIQEQNFAVVPAGYIGVSAMICDTNGRVLVSDPMRYNVTGESWTYTHTSAVYATGTIFSAGKVALFNGVKQVEYDLPESQNVNTGARAAAVASLAERTLTEEGAYPVNSKGQTYGSTLLSKTVGCDPDLIAAVGIDGTEGYILRTDVNPELNSFQAIERYQKDMEKKTDIPLYNAEGVEIGRFQFGHKEEEIPEEVQHSIDLMEQSRQEYMEQVREDIQERRNVVKVLNQEGVEGFCRRKDMEPSWGLTYEELLEYIKVQDTKTYFAVPIYDGDGNEIGLFDMSSPRKISPEVQRDIDRLKTEEVAARSRGQ